MRSLFGWGLVCAAVASAQASVTLTEVKGSANTRGTATFAVDASAQPRELWCAWGASDAGADFAKWARNERVCTVPANATACTAVLPAGARQGAIARFFLFPAGRSYDVDYLVVDGAQCIDTGIFPDPTIAASAEFEMADTATVQQRAFGVSDNAFTLAAYVNGNGYWAWGCRNDNGQWTASNVWPEPQRTVVTVDQPNDAYTLSIAGKEVHRTAISTIVPAASRTKTGTVTLALLANKRVDGKFDNFLRGGRFYRGAVSTATAGAHVYTPYVNAGVAGLKDSAGGFLANAGTGEFGVGGRRDAAGAEAGDAVRLATFRTGDVWSDAKYVFNFDTDLNGDGKVQAGEFRNALAFNSQNMGATVYDAASAGVKGLSWKREDALLPGRGVTQKDMTYLDLPGNWRISGGYTNTWRNGLSFVGTVTGDVTVVARVRVNNFAYDKLKNSTCIFFNNGLDWNRAFGDEFGFTTLNSATGAEAYPYAIMGNKTFTGDRIRLTTNRWYDVAYTLRNLGNGGCETTFAVADWRVIDNSQTGTVYQVTSQTAGCFTNETYYSAATRIAHLGGEGLGGWGRGGDSNSQGAKGFNGSIQRLAVWPRVLSRDEIGEAFVQAPPLFRVGTENGSGGEFGAADATPDTFDAEFDAWHHFRGTLTAEKPEVSLAFTLRGESHLVPYVLRVKAAPGTGDLLLAPYLNDQPLGAKLVRAGRDQTWFVPAAALKTGASTLRLVRKGGSGTVAFDVVELNGSAAIGTDNDTNSEFTQEGYVQSTTYAGMWDWKRYQRAVIGGLSNFLYQRNAYVKFWVPPALATDYSFRYTSKITGQGASKPADICAQYGYVNNQWPLTVYMNEEPVFTTKGSPNGTRIDVTFEPGELHPGWNTVRWCGSGAGQYWVCMDFHKLEIADRPPEGTILLLR